MSSVPAKISIEATNATYGMFTYDTSVSVDLGKKAYIGNRIVHDTVDLHIRTA